MNIILGLFLYYTSRFSTLVYFTKFSFTFTTHFRLYYLEFQGFLFLTLSPITALTTVTLTWFRPQSQLAIIEAGVRGAEGNKRLLLSLRSQLFLHLLMSLLSIPSPLLLLQHIALASLLSLVSLMSLLYVNKAKAVCADLLFFS